MVFGGGENPIQTDNQIGSLVLGGLLCPEKVEKKHLSFFFFNCWKFRHTMFFAGNVQHSFFRFIGPMHLVAVCFL